MKTTLPFLLLLLLLSCKVTKKQKVADQVTLEQEPQIEEEPKQVFIPDDALEMSIPPADSNGAPPPPPPPPSPEEEDIFKVVEEMPRFPGCENIDGTNQEKSTCAKEKMLKYIYSNLVYPQSAIDQKTTGTCVVQFLVKKDGSIGDSNLIRDVGNGCGDAAIDVVNSMNSLEEKWTCGKQRGRPVTVLFTLPVKFKLDEKGKPYQWEN